MAGTDAGTVERPRPRADWSRAAEGIQLAGIGFFLFLNTSGILPWSFWLDAAALWPVLLIVAGLRMTVDRSRVPWLVLLGPVTVLGTLAFVAFGSRPDVPPSSWIPQTAQRAEGVSRWTLRTDLVGSRLDLAARPLDPGLLAQGRSASRDDRARIEVEGGADTATVRLGLRPHVRWGFLTRDRWDLAVTNALPLALDVRGAMIRGRVDLAPSAVSSAGVDGAFIALDLRLPRPVEPVRVRLAGAFNAVHVAVPPGTPVSVRADPPINVVHRATTLPLARADVPGYDVKVEGAFNNVTVEESESASGRPDQPRPPAEAPASARPGHEPPLPPRRSPQG
jgi:hypothetical protein